MPARVYRDEQGEWQQHPLKGWVDVTTTPPLDDWRPRDGVACVLEHSGIVDIDLDAEVAKDLAPVFLRDTATFGRPGRERTHWLYSGGEGRRRTFVDPLGMLVEIRRGGGQTLLPGTRKGWPDAPVWVTWHDDTPITPWTPDDEGRVERLAVACYLALERDALDGQRHESALAFAGILARAGWSLEHAEEVVTAACMWRGDEGLHDRIACVRDTFAAFAERKPVASWAAMRDFMDPKRLAALGKILRCGRARIDLALKFDDVVDRSVEALADVPINDCRVWRHGGQLVRPDLSAYTTPALRTELSRAIDYVRTTEDGEKVVHPPRDVAESVGAADCEAVREIVGVSRVPLLRADGSVVTSRGYDPVSKLWLDPIDVATGHTRAEAEAACVELLDAVADVMWLDPEVDPIVWLAHVLTVVARPLCSTVPVWIYDADAPGCGKTTIARGAGLIGGRCSAVFNVGFGGDEAELVRSIDAHAAGAAVVLDNLRGRIASPALEAALTSGVLRVRRLYVGHCDVQLRAVVSMTGNDAQTGADWARRSLPCLLSKSRELDGARELLEELDAPRFTGAALTMLRAWLRHGAGSEATALPSFRAWSQIVGGCLQWVTGVDVVAATRQRASELTTSENTVGLVDAVADFLHWKQWEARGATASEMLEGGGGYALGDDPGSKLLAALQRGTRGTVTPVTVGSLLRDASSSDPRLQQRGSRRDGRKWYVTLQKPADGDGMVTAGDAPTVTTIHGAGHP